jgi:bacterioferritin-associated ferredoxin
MIVCSCLGVFERTVNRAIDAGAVTVEAVGRACGAGTDCGACHELIDDLIASRMLVRQAGAPANDTNQPPQQAPCAASCQSAPDRRAAR